MDDDIPIRQYAVFGHHGSQIDIEVDGRYVYMHAVEHPEIPNYEYTLDANPYEVCFFLKNFARRQLS